MGDDPEDPGPDIGDRAAVVAVEDLGHHEGGVGSHAGDAAPVVAPGGGDAGDVGAVATVVPPRAAAPIRVAAGADAAGVGHDLAGQVLVVEVDAGVDDADLHPGPGRLRPGGRGADGLESPLPVELGVVAGVGRG